LLVQEVTAGSPAARAGVRGGRQVVQIGNQQLVVGGDLIMAIDGKPVDRQDAISRALARKRAGDGIELTIFRGGRTTNVKLTLADNGDRL
jgi:S1-C subfamily serine protease